MKKVLLLSTAMAFLPALAFAQNFDFSASNDDIAYASLFSGNFSLLLSIVIGLIATFLVFRASQKLRGGLFGWVLNYISIGMLFVVLGTISTVMNLWFYGFWLNIISTAFFAMGYIFMVLGANKLLKGIMNN
jgi:hypothetical protein